MINDGNSDDDSADDDCDYHDEDEDGKSFYFKLYYHVSHSGMC